MVGTPKGLFHELAALQPNYYWVAGSPIVCWFVSSRRRGSPRRSVVDYRPATTTASPSDIPKSVAIASGMPAGTSAVTLAVAAAGGSAAGSGIPFTQPRPLPDLVSETVRRVPPGAATSAKMWAVPCGSPRQ